MLMCMKKKFQGRVHLVIYKGAINLPITTPLKNLIFSLEIFTETACLPQRVGIISLYILHLHGIYWVNLIWLFF